MDKSPNLPVGQILYTKDGRRIGNAIVTGSYPHDKLGTVYFARTDFGNKVVLTEKEIHDEFYVTGLDEYQPVTDNPVTRLHEQLDKLVELEAIEGDND